MSIKVKIGQTQNIRLVAQGEKRPVIDPDSVALGVDTVGEYVRAIDAGVGIVVTPEADTESANLVISHAITTSETSSNNSVLEFIRNASIDQFGHITSLVSTGLDANNFISTNNLITAKNITLGNTAITLGDSVDEIRDLNLLEVGNITVTDDTITSSANLVFEITDPTGVVDFSGAGIRRLVGIDNPIDGTDAVNKRYLEFEIDRVETTVKVFDDPVLETDATNKRYVDNLVKGLIVRPSALAATTQDLGGFFAEGNSSFSSTITLPPVQFLYIDDVTTWEIGSNLLVKDQNNPEENGSYDLVQKGDANTAWIFQRTEWNNESSEVPGSYEFVTDGTVNGGTGWVATVADASTFRINTDAVNWIQFSGEGTYNAGRGLTLNGTTFEVNKTQDIEVISGSGALKIPVGDSSQRPAPSAGMIRFNHADGQFEGYDGIAWAGLGGVIDVDQNTKITAEDSPGANNNELKFYADGVLTAMFDKTAANFYGNVNIGGNITIGDATTDSITVAADFDSNLVANTHNTFDLGKAGTDWRTLYVQNIKGEGELVTFDMTGAVIVPSANTALRPTGQAGMFRFNTDEGRFEGYDGTQWSGLAGSVIDLDRNTYIIAETSAGANNNELDFWTDNVHRAQIDSVGTFRYGAGLDKLTIDYASGDLTVNSRITATNNLVLDPVGFIDVANNTITNLAMPVNPGDAVNLGYLEGQFSSGLTIVDGANTYNDGINLLNSPTIKLGEGLELEEIDSANNTFQIGLDKPGNITPGIYGNDRYMPRFRLTPDGRIDFATEIPVELQANAIPDFTETTRDIIGLMISDGIANNENEGVRIVYDDLNNQIYTMTNDPYISLSGDLSGSGHMMNLSNTVIDATITAPFLRTVDVTDANSGIIVTHTPSANSVALLDLDYSYLDNRYLETTGGTVTGDIIAPRYLDADNTNFYMDPAGVSRLNQAEFGFGSTFSQIKMRDGPGSFSYFYAVSGKIGFLDNTFNFASYSERSTGDWVVQNGDVRAERFVDVDATSYFLHPGGTNSYLKQIEIEDKLTVSDIQIGGDIGIRKIQTTTGLLDIAGSGGISLNGSGNDLNVNNSKITNVLNPTAGQDAATKSYVDSVAQGLRVIPAALAATTTNIGTFAGNIITIAAIATLDIDGVTSWGLGDRLLVKDQTDATENGSYVLTQVGNASTDWQFTRGEYFNQSSEIPGAFQFVTDGTINAGTGWVANVDDAETFAINIDDITFYQFSGAGTYTAGDSLTLNGTEFSIADGDIPNVKLANPQINISGEAGANTVIALGDTLTITGTNGVNTTITNGEVAIAVDELDGGSF